MESGIKRLLSPPHVWEGICKSWSLIVGVLNGCLTDETRRHAGVSTMASGLQRIGCTGVRMKTDCSRRLDCDKYCVRYSRLRRG